MLTVTELNDTNKYDSNVYKKNGIYHIDYFMKGDATKAIIQTVVVPTSQEIIDSIESYHQETMVMIENRGNDYLAMLQ